MSSGKACRRVVFTVCSWNYFAYALTLRDSLKETNTEIEFYVFIADRPQQFAESLSDMPNVVMIDRGIAPNFERMAAYYTITEYNTSVKPHCIDYLFDALGVTSVCYLDPDILVTSALDEIFNFLDSGDECILTPHITEALSDGLYPGDLAISQAGIYNLGFIALRNTAAVRRFVTWWRNWLETDCVVDLPRGIFVDQKFCDFAPAFIERTRILHDPGYNLAYWNLVHRPTELQGSVIYAGGSPVKFIHFSGVNKDKPQEFSKHQNRFTRDTIGALRPFFDRYISSLQHNDYYDEGLFSAVEYGFARMRNGNPIIDGMRRCFRRYEAEIPSGQSPLDVDSAFFMKPTDQLPGEGGHSLSRLLAEIYLSRIDLQRAFDAWTPTGRARLKEWAVFAFPQEYALAPEWADCIVEPSAEQLSKRQNSLLIPMRAAVNAVRDIARKGSKFIPGLKTMFGSKVETEVPAAPPLDFGLAIYGFFHSETGIGQAGRALSMAFETTGSPMSCHAIPNPCCENNVEFPTSPSLDNHLCTALLAMNADNVLHLAHLMNPELIRRNRRIGLIYWELPVFPGIWAKAFETLDEVWVSSSFVANGLKSATNSTVRIVPLPISLNDLDQKASRAALGLPMDRLIYLVTFDFNSFPERKNPLGTVRAFVDAFPKLTDSSPLLVIKCHGAHNRGRYASELKDAISRCPNIMLMDRVVPKSEMLQLQAATDVYVSLHRSEGFGLNLAECMAAGKLVIGTNFSGNLDFMNVKNSLLIDFDMRQVREGDYVAWQGQWWAEPRHDDAVSALRLAESQPAMRLQLGQAARKFIRAELSYAKVGFKMADYVSQLTKNVARN